MNPEQIDLYRMMVSFLSQESNDPKTSRIQKKIVRAFKLPGLKIEIMFNQKVVNFLDITFNLSEDSFKPFHKDTPPILMLILTTLDRYLEKSQMLLI